MKILTIIGNGFDLGHGLLTRFDNFVNSNPVLYKSKYDIFRDKNNSWNDIERKYQQLLCQVMSDRSLLDVMEEVDRIISDYGYNEYGEVDYYNYESEALDDEFDKITEFIDLLEQFERNFLSYLKIACCDKEILSKHPRHAISEILHQSDTIISFNYTHTIELLYEIENVIHIHGDVNDSIAIGSGALEDVKETLIDSEYPTMKKFTPDKHGFAEMMAYYEEDMDGNRVENHFIKRFFDEVSASADEKESEVFSLLDKKSKDSLALRQQVIDILRAEHYDKVYIIGHSLGEADFSVLNSINKNANVICSFYSDDDYPDKEASLKKLGLKYQLVQDSELYRS